MSSYLPIPKRKILAVQVAVLMCLSVQALPQKPCVSVIGKSIYKKVLRSVTKTPSKTFETEKELKSLGFSR